MKAELLSIIEFMSENPELANALDKNFNAINDMAQTREVSIHTAIKNMKQSLRQDIKNSEKVLKNEIKLSKERIDKKLDAILRHLNIDPDSLSG